MCYSHTSQVSASICTKYLPLDVAGDEGFFSLGKACEERRREHASACDRLNDEHNAA